jgi:putative ABC transport system permease protein
MIWVRFRTLVTGVLIVGWRTRVRSALTLLALAVGAASVVGFLAVDEGTKAELHRRVDTLGTDLIVVRPAAGAVLTIEDAGALLDQEAGPDIALVAPEVVVRRTIAFDDFAADVLVLGTTPEYLAMRDLEMAGGRFLVDRDVLATAPVAVLGPGAINQIFPRALQRNQSFLLDRRTFAAVGRLRSPLGTANAEIENAAIVPITTVLFRLADEPARGLGFPLRAISIQATAADTVDEAVEQIASILERRRGRADFVIETQEDLAAQFRDVGDVFRALFGALAIASLVAAGVGVTNVMLASLAERRVEVGVRKAVGARGLDIARQFAGEAVVLAVLGGALGAGVGWWTAGALDRFTVADQSFAIIVRGYVPLAAIGATAIVGLLFGAYPAYRAARTDAGEALL